MTEIKQPSHTVCIENRKSVAFTGITDVIGFDDRTVSLKSELGGVIVKGSDLQINRLSLESGDVSVDGNINSLQYTSAAADSKGVFSKLFR